MTIGSGSPDPGAQRHQRSALGGGASSTGSESSALLCYGWVMSCELLRPCALATLLAMWDATMQTIGGPLFAETPCADESNYPPQLPQCPATAMVGGAKRAKRYRGCPNQRNIPH